MKTQNSHNGNQRHEISRSRAAEKWSPEHITRAAFLLAVLALISVGSLSINSLLEFGASETKVKHTLKVISQAEHMLTDVSDIQNGQRGYIITGEERFLEPYLAARGVVDQDMQQLRQLTADNPIQQRLVDELGLLVNRRIDIAQDQIETRRTQGFEAAQASVVAGKGKMVADQIGMLVKDFVAGEQQLLAERSQQAKSGSQRTIAIILSLVGLAAVILALAALRIRRGIAERKLASTALLESEERFRDLLENANDLILSMRPDGSIIYANRAWRETLGYAEAELAGLSLQDVIHPSSLNGCMQMFQRVLSGEAVERMEAVFQTKTGHAITVEGSSNCHFVEGKPVAIRSIFRDISRSKQAEKERDRLFNYALDMYCIVDFDGNFKQLNPAWEKTLGWSKAEMVGQPYLNFIHPDDHNASVNAARSIEGGEDLLSFDNRYLCKDGTYKWFSWVAFPQAEDGLIFAVARDVTESKRAQIRLAEIMALQRAILDNAGHSIISTTPEGIITTFNPAAERMLGYTAAEMVGLQTLAIIHEPGEVVARAQEFSTELGETIAPGFEVFVAKARLNLPNEYEWTYIRKDGTRFPVLLTVTALSGAGGEIAGFLGLAVDLSERKREEERFRNVVEASPSGMVMVNESGVIILVNSQAEKLFGYARQELIGRLIEILLPERYRAAHPGQRHHFFADPKNRAMGVGRDLFGLRKDGSEFSLEIGLSPLDTPEGKVVLAAVVDITERKRAEQLLRAKNEELKTFAYTVSHDLKAPLRGIVGYAQELERRHKEGLPDRAQFCITQIITASKNLDNLIEDLLKYSRLDTDKPTQTKVNLLSLVQSILRDRNLTITELGVEVSVNVSQITLHIWERGLHQVLANLIDNAIKYSRKSQPPRLTISAEAAAGHCHVTVTDNGIGFDMKYHDRIFGLFNRLVRADEFEGVGVGLAIVKKLTEKFGGSIHAESVPGEGATFFVELPVRNEEKS